MHLKRLEVQHWRGITGPLAVDFHDRLTVVAGPNESGKSSLRDALRRVLLEKFNSQGGVKTVRPWGTELCPTATLTFSIGDDTWRVKKEFLRRKNAAELYRNDRIVAEDGEVQTRIDDLLGAYAQWLDALWGLQGQVDLEASVSNTMRGQLAAASRETVSPGLARLEEKIQEKYDLYWTEKTGKPKAALAKVRQERLQAQTRRQEAQKALEEAREREEALAAQRLDLAGLQERQQRTERDVQASEARLGEWEAWRQSQRALLQLEEKRRSVGRWLEAWGRGVEELAAVAAAVQTYAARLAGAAVGEAPSRHSIEELRCLEKYWHLSIQLDLVAELGRLPLLDRKDMTRLQTLDRDLHRLQAGLDAGLMTVTLEALRPIEASVDVDGEVSTMVVGPAVEAEWSAASTFVLTLPEVGVVRVRSGNVAATEKLAERSALQKEQALLLKKARARSVEEALDVGRRRSQVEAELGGATPERTEWESLRAQIADVADLEPPDKKARLAVLPALLATAEAAWRAAQTSYAVAQTRYQQLLAESPQEALRGQWRSMQTLLETAAAVQDRVVLPAEWTPAWQAEATQVVEPWRKLHAQLALEVTDLQAQHGRPPGEEVSGAGLEAQRAELEALRQEVQALDQQVQQGVGGLKFQGDFYHRLAQAEEAEARADLLLRQVETDAAAARLLYQTFQRARERLQQEVVTPLENRVAERLQQMTAARYQGVHFAQDLRLDSVVPMAVARAGVGDLSFGTQEQLLLLTRLCLAEMLADNALPQVVILDDNLVHTDSERMALACRMLAEASARVQVVVFTCHPERYVFEGAPMSLRQL